MKHHLVSFSTLLALVLSVMSLYSCASAPRTTIDQVPIYPGAVALPPGEHVASAPDINSIAGIETALGQNFKWQGIHAESSFRIPAAGAKYSDVTGWYYKTLTAAGWRSTYAVAYTVYVNGAGQYLTVYVIASPANNEDYELLLTLNE